MKKIKGMMNFDELVTRTLNMCKSMLHGNGNGNAEGTKPFGNGNSFFLLLGIRNVLVTYTHKYIYICIYIP